MSKKLQFYSHRNPDILLIDHLRSVADRMVRYYRKEANFVNLPIDEDFIRAVGFSHDFGKYTKFFQDYLCSGSTDIQNRHYHGFLSALFGAWYVIKFQKEDHFLPLIAYLSIKHHHGNLKNLGDDCLEKLNLLNLRILKDQIEDLKKNKAVISKELGVDIEEFCSTWRDVWKKIEEYALKFNNFTHNRDYMLRIYFTLLYVYSLLIDSDKKHVSGVEDVKRRALHEDLVEQYRKKKGWEFPEKDIDILRNEIYNDVKEMVSTFTDPPKISTITAPTGLGKTFLNIDVALRYRKKLGGKSRIIYSLPYISIIDQVCNRLDDMFRETLGEEYVKNQTTYLLKHHHLAKVEYRSDGEEKPVSEALALIESWSSEVVVTTFYQLLHTVIGYENALLKKFHNIAGSIIILDEVQAIDCKYWEVVNFVLKGLTHYLGCRIILSTATRPMIFNPEEFTDSREFAELVRDYKRYFSTPNLNRTRLVPLVSRKEIVEMDVNGFARKFIEDLKRDSGRYRSYLVVLNTIRSSIHFYEKIKDEVDNDFEIFYLSTSVVPVQRRERLEKIQHLLSEGKKKVILVSTQVVEAGVDLDFDKVYRDIGPLDSIIQVAGRCNRNKCFDLGEVEIVFLRDDKNRGGKLFSTMVYGSTLTNTTIKLLKKLAEEGRESYEETEYEELANRYFSQVKNDNSGNKSEDIIEYICNLNFFSDREGCIANNFKVVEEKQQEVDIFVEIDERARSIYECFTEKVFMEEDFRRRLENYYKLKNDFYDYVISIRKEYYENLPADIKTKSSGRSYIPRIPLDCVDLYYDIDGCGFRMV